MVQVLGWLWDLAMAEDQVFSKAFFYLVCLEIMLYAGERWGAALLPGRRAARAGLRLSRGSWPEGDRGRGRGEPALRAEGRLGGATAVRPARSVRNLVWTELPAVSCRSGCPVHGHTCDRDRQCQRVSWARAFTHPATLSDAEVEKERPQSCRRQPGPRLLLGTQKTNPDTLGPPRAGSPLHAH